MSYLATVSTPSGPVVVVDNRNLLAAINEALELGYDSEAVTVWDEYTNTRENLAAWMSTPANVRRVKDYRREVQLNADEYADDYAGEYGRGAAMVAVVLMMVAMVGVVLAAVAGHLATVIGAGS